MNNYGDCVHCGGLVVEKMERVDYRYHGQLFILENVPTGVCQQCGEKYFTAQVSKKMEEATGHTQSLKSVAVPIISLAA